jgi:hypothetical protein
MERSSSIAARDSIRSARRAGRALDRTLEAPRWLGSGAGREI